MWWLVSSLCLITLAGGCTLDIDVRVEPPPENWDPSLNTHPSGPVFQNLLDEQVHDGLPGAVLYVRTPEGLWNGAAGKAKLETATPMVPTHRFPAASVTKMYTATAVLLLAENGRIDLDARISRYLPAGVGEDVPNGSTATVRQVMGHTSGIPDFSGSSAYDLDTLNAPMGSFPPDRLLGYLEGQSPIFSPGGGYFYSNANYLLLALMVDHVTGGSHADVISERILGPIGLRSTYYKNEPNYPQPPGLVNTYRDLLGNGRLMNVSDLTIHGLAMSSGYAGLIATSADFATFVDALFDERVLSPASEAAMRERTRCDCYGLGLSFKQTPYGMSMGHTGGDFGVLTQVRRFPELDATLVLLVNGGDSGVTDRLFQRLWDHVMQAALGALQPVGGP
jgi:D-alanyl-D-alanine carboxypeptidase